MLVLSGEYARRLSWLLAMSVTSTYPTTHLLGRCRECAVLDDLLGHARTGTSGVLVVRGEAGIGKTALLDYAASRATGFRVARVGALSPKWNSPSPVCTCCSGRCSTGSSACPIRSAMR
jgi:hypothetical protein